jgi:hypothetical protein
MVEQWVKDLTEEVMGGPPVEIGKRYMHPEDGLIEVTSGQYWGDYGLSNFWYWTVIATGETKHGYAAPWPQEGGDGIALQ